MSVFATTGIVSLFRGLQKSENEALGRNMLFPDGHQIEADRYPAKNVTIPKKRSYIVIFSAWCQTGLRRVFNADNYELN
jgi:hypothetical protein